MALPKVGTSTAPGATSPPRTAAAAAAGTWWEVKGTTLDVENANGRYNNYARVIPLPSAFATSAGRAKLTVDPVTGWVWVVLEGSRPSFMLRVSARFARVMREIRWPMPVHDVAAYAGRLYLSTDRGIATLAPHGAQPRLLPGLAGVMGPLAVDPARHRVIALDLDHHRARIWAIRPGTSPAETDSSFSADHATIAVVAGAIWILAANAGHASLLPLGPATLRPTRPMRLPDGLSARAVLVPDGDEALWLSGPVDGDRLVCANVKTGAALHTWPYRDVDSIASDRDHALIAAGSQFHRVRLRPCRSGTGRVGAAPSTG